MRNISNLDVKRKKLGYTSEITAFKGLEIYRKSGIKKKLELVSLISVLKYQEKNFDELALLILKFEKVPTIEKLISKYSKMELDAILLASKVSSEGKSSEVPQTNPVNEKQIENTITAENQKILKIIGISFLGIVLFAFTFQQLSKTQNKPVYPTQKPYREVKRPPIIDQNEYSQIISLIDQNGMKYISVKINGIRRDYLFDTGASNTLISKTYLNRLRDLGYLSRANHFIETQNVQIANGDIIEAEFWNIPKMVISDKAIYNVRVAVLDIGVESSFLFGMSALEKLNVSKLDLSNNKIFLSK
jgi:clan AA aspartic protease (TIGR02281 family)